MINLDNITLACISSDKVQESLKAIEICKQHINFNQIILFSDIDTPYTTRIRKIDSVLQYNEFSYYELPYYIDSEFVLTIQWDGFIVNPSAWTDEFLKYDYIGATWPWNKLCGNSGFCLRSKKFLDQQKILAKQHKLTEDSEHGKHGLNDDVMMCLKLRSNFIEAGCVFSPPEIAYKFSVEYGTYEDHKSFGFHDFRQHPQFKNLIYGEIK